MDSDSTSRFGFLQPISILQTTNLHRFLCGYDDDPIEPVLDANFVQQWYFYYQNPASFRTVSKCLDLGPNTHKDRRMHQVLQSLSRRFITKDTPGQHSAIERSIGRTDIVTKRTKNLGRKRAPVRGQIAGNRVGAEDLGASCREGIGDQALTGRDAARQPDDNRRAPYPRIDRGQSSLSS